MGSNHAGDEEDESNLNGEGDDDEKRILSVGRQKNTI